MKSHKVYIVIILCLVMLACNQIERKKESKNSIVRGNVVLIFKDIPINWKYTRNNGGYSHRGRHEVKYSIDGIIPTYYYPKYLKGNDTVIIQNVSKPIEIEHKYKGLDVFSFIAIPLDTLLFSYQENKPIVQNLNRTNARVGINYESIIREKVYTSYFSSFIKFRLPSIFFMENIDYSNFRSIDSIFKSKHFIKAKEELKREKSILDSLIGKHKISAEYSKFYNLRNKYRQKILEIEKKPYSNFKDFQQNDSLLKFSFYREYVNAILDNGILKTVKQKRTSNSLVYDSKTVYDSINKNPYISKETKKYLSFLWLERIISSSSNKKINNYFKLFKSSYGNDINLIDYLNKKYNLNVTFSNDLLLEDKHGHKTSFDKILKKNKGKFLYVNFWASWCSPCRIAMKYAKSLREEYKNENIVFLYLALNDKKEEWEKVSEIEDLSNNANNFLITNSRTSSLIDDLNIKRIPRYMIYNKQGELVHKNAPGPKGREIRVLLNEQLKE